MSEMIERVAEAIAKEVGRGPNFKEMALAAIAAMREPTEAMVKAGGVYWDPCDGSPIRMAFDPTKPYQKMIDEALR